MIQLSNYLSNLEGQLEIKQFSELELQQIAAQLDRLFDSVEYNKKCLDCYSRGDPIKSIIDQLINSSINYSLVKLFEYEFNQITRSSVLVGKVLNYPFIFKQIFAYIHKYWKLRIK